TWRVCFRIAAGPAGIARRIWGSVRMYRAVILASVATAVFTPSAAAQAQPGKAIYTASEAGAYHAGFCPRIPIAMANAGFPGYVCTPSGGTPDNITKVLADPRTLGFAQLDVLAPGGVDN